MMEELLVVRQQVLQAESMPSLSEVLCCLPRKGGHPCGQETTYQQFACSSWTAERAILVCLRRCGHR